MTKEEKKQIIDILKEIKMLLSHDFFTRDLEDKINKLEKNND